MMGGGQGRVGWGKGGSDAMLRSASQLADSSMRPLLHRATLCCLIGLSSVVCACSSQPSNSNDSLATAGSSGSEVGCRPSDGDTYAPGLKKSGTAGRFDFTLVSSTPAPPSIDDNRFILRVTDAEGNAVDGELSVALDMPEHGHPSPKRPDIGFDAESQTFVLEPMRLFMVGLWRITFSIQATVDGNPQADTATFEFCID